MSGVAMSFGHPVHQDAVTRRSAALPAIPAQFRSRPAPYVVLAGFQARIRDR
ncbi:MULTISPECIES: hypothetical protein [Rhodococcus]|uniref:hypothetical protein n=1 Tax=Rhodococcus TaxID=1827 RepID=UPI0029530DC4|nr:MULTISPECIES: hypothetical protein [Rhodococcus]MDV8028431.1 hypothetical protein [Rhodococcus sp. IEGM 27]